MKKMRCGISFIFVFMFFSGVYAQYPGQFQSKLKVKPQVPFEAYAFNLSDVRLLDSRFKKAMELDQKWLLSLSTDRLLHNYRVNAGLRTNAEELGGWERLDVELRGHSVGHIMSALAMMYGSTGDPVFKQKGDSLVAGLAECQKALDRGGYLSAFPEHLIDRAINGEPVWAPFYTLHKIYAGLLDMYLRTDNQQALDVATKMADWAYDKLSPLSEEQVRVLLKEEYGGMNEVMYNLYAFTGNEKYRELGKLFYDASVLDPLVNGKDPLPGLHANTQIPKAIGAARGYELTGSDREGKASQSFWNTVIQDHTYVIGGNSDGEHFGPPGELSDRLSSNTTETCNTYNMLKLTGHLFNRHASAKYVDYYERALYNHILASQNPETGMVCYYVSLRPGGSKNFSTRTNSFWCCVGTGFENHAKYGETIYYRGADNNSLYVNLFIPSVLTWSEKDIKVRQTTNYPEEPTTTLTISADQPVQMPIKIRYPGWSKGGISVTVNGNQVPVNTEPGSYIQIDRRWRDGDTINVEFSMNLYTEAMPDDPNMAAVLYGPVVLAGDLGSDGEAPSNAYEIPALVANQQSIEQWAKPVQGKPLNFRTKGVGRPEDVLLRPFYKVYKDHYTVYWDFLSQQQWQKRHDTYEAYKAEQADIANRTIDELDLGESSSEEAHNFNGENTESRNFRNRYWRTANDGGWFEYDMKVNPGEPAELLCSYWGREEAGGFDLLVNGQQIKGKEKESLVESRTSNMLYQIPATLTEGASSVKVRFQARHYGAVNGVFECRMLSKK